MKVYYTYESTGHELADNMLLLHFEKYRHRIMWRHRHLEYWMNTEMEESIIISSNDIELRGFSDTLK